MTPHTVLFVPTDPGMLAEDALGSAPPKVPHAEDNCFELKSPTWGAYGGACGCGAWALVLRWQGETLRLGVLWLAWHLEESGWEPLADEQEPHEFLGWRAFDLTPEAVAGYADASGLGRAVVLEAG